MEHRPAVKFRFIYYITKYNTQIDNTDRSKSIGSVEGLGGVLVGGGVLGRTGVVCLH